MPSARATGTNENVSTYGSGLDYTAFGTWEAATDNDNQAGEVSEVLECAAGTYNDALTMNGATNSATYPRIVRPNSASFHDGTPSGVKVEYTGGNTGISLAESFCYVQDICCKVVFSSTSAIRSFLLSGADIDGCQIVGCIAYDTANANTGTAFGIQWSSTAKNFLIIDCIVINVDDYGLYCNLTADGTGNKILNCTVFGGTDGLRIDAGSSTTLVVRNILASDASSADYIDGTAGIDADYIATKDASAVGANSRASQTFSFVDSGNDDLHLLPTDEGALGYGENQSAIFNDDIDRNPFVNWSMGAHAAAPPSTGGNLGRVRRQRRKRFCERRSTCR
jgi:hypothetical protein